MQFTNEQIVEMLSDLSDNVSFMDSRLLPECYHKGQKFDGHVLPPHVLVSFKSKEELLAGFEYIRFKANTVIELERLYSTTDATQIKAYVYEPAV